MAERILIVDDNERNLKLAKVVLELEGFTVDAAFDAEQAVTRLEAARPDLVLMDLQLPGMDGLTLTRRIKADPRTRDVIVVALTAFAMKGDDERAYAAGCDGYIAKPIDVLTFARTVRAFLAAGPKPPQGGV